MAIELKVDRFEPEHLGKLNFYLEALDRDVRKPHENPAIGVLLSCKRSKAAAGDPVREGPEVPESGPAPGSGFKVRTRATAGIFRFNPPLAELLTC